MTAVQGNWSTWRRIARAAVVLIGVFALASCSNTPYPPVPEGRKVLYTSLHEDPRQGLDPVSVTDTVAAALVSQMYDSLYEYHYLKRPYEITPAIAADLPQFSTDGLVITVPLKRGVRYIDDPCFPNGIGREVVASDFVYAFKRLADVNSGSKNYWLVQGKIVGLDTFHEASSALAERYPLRAGSERQDEDTAFLAAIDELYAQNVPGLQTPDPYTLQIHLIEPFPQLKYVLAMCNLAAQPAEAVRYYGCHPGRDRAEFFRHPVGSGPFMLKEWREQQRIVMVRNPTYREDYYPFEGEVEDRERGLLDAAGMRLPLVDEIQYTIIRESLPAWIYFRQGYVDLSGIPRDVYNEVVTANFNLSPQFQARGFTLIREEEMSLFWKMFNMVDPDIGDGPRTADGGYVLDEATRLRNRMVRQAIALGYDRARVIRNFLNGRGILARGPIPKGMYGYDAQPESPYLRYDPEAARRRLAEAGFPEGRKPDGTRLRFVFDLQGNDPTLKQMARSFVRDMETIGIEIEIRANTWAEYLRRTHEGRFQIADSGWQLDYPDPENFLQLLYGPNRPPKSNSASYWNLEFDRMYEIMRNMPDSPERLDLIRRMVALFHEDMPWIAGFSRVSFVLVPPWRKNYKPLGISGGYAKYSDLDVVLRDRLRAEWNQPRYDILAGLVVLGVTGVVVLTRIRVRGA